MNNVRGQRNSVGKGGNIGSTASCLNSICAGQVVDHRDHILGLITVKESDHGLKDILVIVEVKIIRRDKINSLCHHSFLLKDGAKNTLFCLFILGRQSVTGLGNIGLVHRRRAKWSG